MKRTQFQKMRQKLLPEVLLQNHGGTILFVVEDLLQRREKYAISYVSVFDENMEDFAPVVARLVGT